MKVKFIIRPILFVGFFVLLSSQIPENWVTLKYEKVSWNELKQKAKREKKPFFVKCYTKWCPTCRYMQKHILSDQEVAKFYNDNFLNFNLNMEKKEGLWLKDTLKVTAYPTFIYFDQNGNELHRFLGGQDANEIIQTGKDVLAVRDSLP